MLFVFYTGSSTNNTRLGVNKQYFEKIVGALLSRFYKTCIFVAIIS